MISAASLTDAKEELRSVLSSSAFRQSPALSRLLQYLCSKAVLDDASKVTEYVIAVDVFGKPENFKDSKDAIVRVEMHRLRKRLAQFYEGEGSGHGVRIVIPAGQYVPEFQIVGDVPTETRELPRNLKDQLPELSVPDSPESAPFVPKAVGFLRLRISFLVVLLCVVGGLVLASTVRNHASGVRRPEVRILAGLANGSYTDASGNVWQSDRYFKGGTSRAGRKDLIPRPPEGTLYQTMREADGSKDLLHEAHGFSYDIPLKSGTWDLRLYFADPLYENPLLGKGQDGQNIRRFRVLANGRPVLEQFDAVADAGFAAVTARAFKNIAPAADGLLHLEFLPDPHPPFVNAIELVPSQNGRANPVRVSARQESYMDPDGKLWSADNFFIRGRLIRHPVPEGAPRLPGLYSDERYGNFTYAIPVPPGTYSLTLHFAETMFTPVAPSTICRGPGCRVFDVSCNGVLLLTNFDVFQAAGGAYRPVSKTFHGLHPNGQGKLLVAFSPSVNYAEIRAIEVIDEGQ